MVRLLLLMESYFCIFKIINLLFVGWLVKLHLELFVDPHIVT